MNPTLLSPLTFTGTPGVKVLTDKENGQVYALEGRPVDLPSATPEKSDAYAYLKEGCFAAFVCH
jgi:hypothetical protein